MSGNSTGILFCPAYVFIPLCYIANFPTASKLERCTMSTPETKKVCFNAFGNCVPPLITFPRKMLDTGIERFTEAIYSKMADGWMDKELSEALLQHSFNL